MKTAQRQAKDLQPGDRISTEVIQEVSPVFQGWVLIKWLGDDELTTSPADRSYYVEVKEPDYKAAAQEIYAGLSSKVWATDVLRRHGISPEDLS